MISITGITTMNISEINNIITVVFFLLIFSLRNIIAGVVSTSHRKGILLQNLNLVSIPLLIVITALLIYNILT